jgi:hypothetical protein
MQKYKYEQNIVYGFIPNRSLIKYSRWLFTVMYFFSKNILHFIWYLKSWNRSILLSYIEGMIDVKIVESCLNGVSQNTLKVTQRRTSEFLILTSLLPLFRGVPTGGGRRVGRNASPTPRKLLWNASTAFEICL